jgi:hypothetical protein
MDKGFSPHCGLLRRVGGEIAKNVVLYVKFECALDVKRSMREKLQKSIVCENKLLFFIRYFAYGC